eukprot:TRINITY_DN31948_c0_g1_i2.p1 TRINITY_DN31948_c0_g1~~TRINITY_DN31948_c0_g1_i2.p1  ORF type:complete len:314 (+),score=85.49 TRINITY_DN31948_c0_g1_i2:64-1005(+)
MSLMRVAPRVAGAWHRGSLRFAASWISQETPNPDVRKFESGTAVPSIARGQLLELAGVRDVFVGGESGGSSSSTGSWIAVTRDRNADWQLLAPRVQELLQGLPEESPEHSAAAQATHWAGGVEQEIFEVLEHRVRPSVQDDGGDVELLRWEAASGQVVLRLKGACRGCPQSAVTLQETILKTLKHFVPEVRSVHSEEEEADPTQPADPWADIPWTHTGDAEPDAIRELASAGTPFFSTFAGTKVEGPKLRRVRFMSRVELEGRTPGHIIVTCEDCKARRAIEDPQDLLRADKGNTTGNAAVVICPTCCVLISK